ncbi:larval cuticle protein 16/17-like [Macrobrachium rosenbergii]|uniref:larval cuticle protein 16/17-like n=1 Tax=Macrobrachium rosenbergii TaxID=79674 RepID=UPI0034D48CA4
MGTGWALTPSILNHNWASVSALRATMKVLVLVCLGLATLVAARPSNDVIDFETDHMEHEQEGQPGRAVEGEYSWVAPDGNEYHVKYVADHLGYRVVEDNVVPEVVEAIPVEDAEEGDDEPAARAIEEEEEEVEEAEGDEEELEE